MFTSVENLAQRLERARYVADPVMLNVIYMASKLGKPILAEGPPGSGKAELARVVTIAAETHIERLECYAGLKGKKAVGSYENGLLVLGPLLRALSSAKPCVLLIEGVDRLGQEFEAQLVEILEEWQVDVAGLGSVKAQSIPFVVLTSTQQRRIGDPLRRRCLTMRFDHSLMEEGLCLV